MSKWLFAAFPAPLYSDKVVLNTLYNTQREKRDQQTSSPLELNHWHVKNTAEALQKKWMEQISDANPTDKQLTAGDSLAELNSQLTFWERPQADRGKTELQDDSLLPIMVSFFPWQRRLKRVVLLGGVTSCLLMPTAVVITLAIISWNWASATPGHVRSPLWGMGWGLIWNHMNVFTQISPFKSRWNTRSGLRWAR